MDLNSLNKEIKYPKFDGIFINMPYYLASRHRVHRMFFKRCEEEINNYEECLEDRSWKSNIDQYISDEKRRKCYKQWVYVRRCAQKHLGDSFAAKINMSRQLVEPQKSTEEVVAYYESMIKNRLNVIKIELPSEEEEATEEEGTEEEEATEEEAPQEEAPQEESSGEESSGVAQEETLPDVSSERTSDLEPSDSPQLAISTNENED